MEKEQTLNIIITYFMHPAVTRNTPQHPVFRRPQFLFCLQKLL